MSINLFFISFLLTVAIVPIIIKIAYKTNFVDVPNQRKVHSKPKPYLGGVGIYLSTLVVYLYSNEFYLNLQDRVIWGVGLIVLIIGLVDDKRDMRAMHKFFLQIGVSILASLFLENIYSFEIFGHVFNFTYIEAILIQAIWIFAIMNAFNLIDGLDGLASGLGLITLVFLYIIMFLKGDNINEVYIVIMIGSLLGFLYHNFYPSSIFLGDAGSMFIGFYIAIISFSGYKTTTITTVSVLLMVVAIPVMDILLAVIRRKRNNRKIFSADALHFHHRLLRHGFSTTRAVIIMYIIMIIYGLEAIILTFADSPYVIGISIVVIIIVTELIIEYLYMLSDKFTIIRKIINKIREKNE